MTELNNLFEIRPALMIAFDIGVGFSGVSFAIRREDERPLVSSPTRYPGQTSVEEHTKIPSTVYYDTTGTVRAVGAECLLTENIAKAKEEGWTKAEWWKLYFKMRDPATLANNPYPIPPLPPRKSLVDILSDLIRYLYSYTLECVKLHHPSGRELFQSPEQPKVEFVFVQSKAGWEDLRGYFYSAAVLAGLIPDSMAGQGRLRFIEEGEVGLAGCLMDDGCAGLIKAGQSVVLVDAGAKTVNVYLLAVKEITPHLVLGDSQRTRCFLQGSQIIDQRFRYLLEDRLKHTQFDTTETLTILLEIFEALTKPKFKYTSDVCVLDFGGREDNDARLGIVAGRLKLSGDEVAGLFEPSISVIVDSLRSLESSEPISSVFLVGGLSNNFYFVSRLRDLLHSTLNLSLHQPSNRPNFLSDNALHLHLARLENVGRPGTGDMLPKGAAAPGATNVQKRPGFRDSFRDSALSWNGNHLFRSTTPTLRPPSIIITQQTTLATNRVTGLKFASGSGARSDEDSAEVDSIDEGKRRRSGRFMRFLRCFGRSTSANGRGAQSNGKSRERLSLPPMPSSSAGQQPQSRLSQLTTINATLSAELSMLRRQMEQQRKLAASDLDSIRDKGVRIGELGKRVRELEGLVEEGERGKTEVEKELMKARMLVQSQQKQLSAMASANATQLSSTTLLSPPTLSKHSRSVSSDLNQLATLDPSVRWQDRLSVTDVKKAVDRLNDKICHWVDSLKEDVLKTEYWSPAAKALRAQKQCGELKTEFDDVVNLVGNRAAYLLKDSESWGPGTGGGVNASEPEGGIALEVLGTMIQACLVSVLATQVLAWWGMKPTDVGSQFQAIYQRIAETEGQEIAGRWRAMTLAQLFSSQPTTTTHTTATTKHTLTTAFSKEFFITTSMQSVIIPPIVSLLQVTHLASTPTAARKLLTKKHLDDLHSLAALAMKIRRMTAEKVVSVDLEVYVILPGMGFESGIMKEDYRRAGNVLQLGGAGNTGRGSEKVLCNSGLGLVQREARIGAGAGNNVVLLKPKVILDTGAVGSRASPRC